MVFSPKKDQKDKENMIGFNVSRETHEHIKLVSVHKEVYMANILIELTNEYLKTCPSAKKLIELLAKKAHKEWDKMCMIKSKKNGWRTGTQLTKKWDLFVASAKENLRLRKVNEDLIDMIITKLEQLEIDR